MNWRLRPGEMSLKPFQVAALLYVARFAAAHARPHGELVVALDETAEHQPPDLLFVAGEADALEGDGGQDRIAIRGEPALGVPEGVPTGIVLDPVGDVAVGLYSVRVDVEPVHVPVVVKSIDIEDHAVIVHDLIVLGDPSANQLGIVLADEGRVQVLVVIGEVGRRRLRHRLAVARRVLTEIGDHEFRLARDAVQKIAELGGAADARDA